MNTDFKILSTIEYFDLLEDISVLRDKDSIALLLDKHYEKYSPTNPNYIKYLSQHTYAINLNIKDEESDLRIKNGDFVIEKGDIALGSEFNPFAYTELWIHEKNIETSQNKLDTLLESDNLDFNSLLMDNLVPEIYDEDYISDIELSKIDLRRAKRIAESYKKVTKNPTDITKKLDLFIKSIDLSSKVFNFIIKPLILLFLSIIIYYFYN
ncbi:hypothetical protein [Flammeovirga sp. OC4]|uniref:hypothetical protein n=1 Tax=Flammeovirga sp. OC4 TaxID=1382345 RepID=UPI0005C63E48|nr:hypothetical protein [Flammeovirga sp. OC4]